MLGEYQDEIQRLRQENAQIRYQKEIKERDFGHKGSFGLGITEHVNLGIKYDQSIGIYGMGFYVRLACPDVQADLLHA